MRNLIQFIIYLGLLFLGFLGTSWIIWSRFIRERTIREIPDVLLTEYRFWILLYICCIYIYVIKSSLIPKKASSISEIFSKFNNVIYKPLITLDHTIKRSLLKDKYYNFTLFITDHINIRSSYKPYIIFAFRLIPRGILVLFLCADTFYFHKLDIFYKVIILGILPLVYRYLKYTIQDIMEYHIGLLEEKYDMVRIYQEGFEFDYPENEDEDEDEREYNKTIPKSTAKYHNMKVSIREYIKIKDETDWDWVMDEVPFRYLGTAYAKRYFYENFRENKYPLINGKRKFLTAEDCEEIGELFNVLIDRILKTKSFIEDLSAWEQNKRIRYVKAGIFGLFLICWSYILFISYKYYPIELDMGKYLLSNFMLYLCNVDNPFSELYWGSINENLVNMENIKYFMKRVFNKFF